MWSGLADKADLSRTLPFTRLAHKPCTSLSSAYKTSHICNDAGLRYLGKGFASAYTLDSRPVNN